MKTRFWFVCAQVWLVSLSGPITGGTTPSGLVREGNDFFALGSYDEAMSRYRQAAKERPDAPEIAFNQGAVLFKKNDFAGAARKFEEAAQQAADPRLAAKAEYNRGNSCFREAERTRESDRKESIKATRQSVGSYREALRLDPAHREAAENLELARMLLKDLIEEQKQQPQSQDQQGDESGEQGEQQQMEQGGQGQEQEGEQQQGQDQAGQQEREEKEEEKQAGQDTEEEKKEGGAQEGKEQKEEQPQGAEEKQGQEEKGSAGEEEREQFDEAARAILEEEKENQARRARLPRGVRPVEKDW